MAHYARTHACAQQKKPKTKDPTTEMKNKNGTSRPPSVPTPSPAQPHPASQLRQTSNRIPQRQHNRLHLQHIHDSLRHERRVHNHLIAVLAHPIVAHHQVPLLARRVAPRVFNAPLDGLAVDDVDRAEDHGVGHEALARQQALRLVHAEGDVEAELVVDEVGVEDALLRVGVLADVAAEEDGALGFEHGDAGGFHGLGGGGGWLAMGLFARERGEGGTYVHVDVDVAYGPPADDVAESRDG